MIIYDVDCFGGRPAALEALARYRDRQVDRLFGPD